MTTPAPFSGKALTAPTARPLVAVLTLALITRLAAALYLGEAVTALPGIADQLSYHALALRVLGGHGFSFEQAWWPMTAAGAPTAHWSFLYTLYLAAVYAVTGVHPLAARLLQVVAAGILWPWLTYRLTWRVFKSWPAVSRIAWLAALWTALYGYFIYYSAALMTETFYILAILWTLDCSLRLVERPAAPWRMWLELGLALGVAVLLRQVFLLFIPFLFLWLVWRRWAALRRTLSGLALALVLLGLLIGPFAWRNWRVFHHFVLLNTNAGFAFYWSNHPIHGTRFIPLFTDDMPSYQDLTPPELLSLNEAELSDALMARGLDFIRADPVRFIRLSLSRIPVYFMFWPSSASSLLSNLVRVSSLGVALPFMLIGAWRWWRSPARHADPAAADGFLLLLFILVYSAVHLASWAGIRYRLPVDAAALIFAAYGLQSLLPLRLASEA